MITITSKMILLSVDLLAILALTTGVILSYTHSLGYLALFRKYFIPSILWFIVGHVIYLGYFDSDPQLIVALILAIQMIHYILDSDRFKATKKTRNKRFNEFSKEDYQTNILPSKKSISEEDKRLEQSVKIIKETNYNQARIAKEIRETGKVDGLWVIPKDMRKYYAKEGESTTNNLEKDKED